MDYNFIIKNKEKTILCKNVKNQKLMFKKIIIYLSPYVHKTFDVR